MNFFKGCLYALPLSILFWIVVASVSLKAMGIIAGLALITIAGVAFVESARRRV